MPSERASRPQSLFPQASRVRRHGEPDGAPKPGWERVPVWLALVALTGVAIWTGRLLQREIERSVADELHLILAAELEVAAVLLERHDKVEPAPRRPAAGQADALAVTHAQDLGRVLASLPVLSRVGRSGETYAFDREGIMRTPSRFDDELREQDLLLQREGRAVVELRDPGGHVAAGYRPALARHAQPLTKAVAEAIAGRDGVDVTGYRDYRGVMVVGAWRWLPEYDLGVVVEIDASEALELHEGLRSALFAVYLATALALLAVGGSSRVYARAKTQIALAAQLGQYTLVRELGRGGMGVVYEARHAMLRRPTAVKLMTQDSGDLKLDTEALLRFEREVQLTSELSHPNTVTIYDYGRSDEGLFYYAMEYIDGVDLDRLVRVDGPLGPGRAIHFALQICGSLAEAHGKSLIHRDIKPANVLVCERGGVPDRVKVLDFGLVKSLLGPQVSAAHVLVGTPQFMAPEVLRDPRLADARSDLYGVGAVLYWLVTGKPIFEPGTRALREDQEIAPPTSLGADVPADLERVIMRCLARYPEQRPRGMTELASELSGCRAHGSWSEQDARRYWRERGSLLNREQLAAPDVPTLAAS